MSEVQNYNPQPMVFTKDAANKVRELIEEEGNLNLNLRVYITGGGCSGFQYGFAFEEEIAEDDTVVTQEAEEGGEGSGTMTIKLLVDPMSYTYLVGAKIDYKDDLEGGRFIIGNPNAETTCGCGSSFSV